MTVYQASWLVSVEDYIEDRNWPIEHDLKKSYIEYVSKDNSINYRSITLLRRKSKNCWNEDYVADPKDPPIIWTFWSHWSHPTMIAYLEELKVRPESAEVEFLMNLFDLWLVKAKSMLAFLEAVQKHPRHYMELPSHRKNTRKQPIATKNQYQPYFGLIQQMSAEEAQLREFYDGFSGF